MKHVRILALASLFLAGVLKVHAQTAFTYQGRLTVGGVVTNGSYDLKFSLYDALTGGTQIGVSRTNALTAVTNGLFTLALDFGATAFNGDPRWLQIAVRPGGSNTLVFTPLTPRQAVNPTPYALYAQTAGSVDADTVVVSNSTSLAGNIQFAGNSAAPGYVWTASDTNGNGQWVAAPTGSGTFNPTNVIFYTTNNSDGQAGSGWRVIPTNILSAWPPGGGNAKWFAMTAPISNAALGHWGEFRALSTVQANQYGDPLGDLTYNFGFNQGGDETGNSNYGRTATNMPNWQKQVETSWQNYPGATQMEDWWSWGSPYTQWGTNSQWRWFGADLYWDSTTKRYQDSDAGFYVDHFYIGGAFNRAANNGNYGFQVNDQGNGVKDVKVYGYITTYTNASNYGGIALKGGRLDLMNASETANTAFSINSENELLMHGNDSTPPIGHRVWAYAYNRFEAKATNAVPLEVMGAYNGHATNLFEAKANPSGTVLASIDHYGNGKFANFRAGVTNIDNLSTTLVITFTPAFYTTNYSVTVSPEFDYYPGYYFISDKTTNSFQFNLPAHSSSGNISWQAMLPQ